MTHEEEIVDSLCTQFPFLTDRVYIQKDKRVFTKPVTKDEFDKIIPYIHEKLGFFRASHVVGTDEVEDIGLIYILSDTNNVLLMLREHVPKTKPVVKSISDMYKSIILHEREIVDLFGVVVEGLPDGPHYPLPDGWPEGSYPMRKEWDPKLFNKDTMKYEASVKDEVQKDG